MLIVTHASDLQSEDILMSTCVLRLSMWWPDSSQRPEHTWAMKIHLIPTQMFLISLDEWKTRLWLCGETHRSDPWRNSLSIRYLQSLVLSSDGERAEMVWLYSCGFISSLSLSGSQLNFRFNGAKMHWQIQTGTAVHIHNTPQAGTPLLPDVL